MYKKLISLLSLSAFVFGAVIPSASASHTWGNYHWARTTSTFDLQIVNTMSSQWQSSFGSAVTDWNASDVLTLVPSTGSAKRGCRGQDGKVEACNAEYGATGWLGIAQIWASGDHITKGIVKMNDTYYNTATYNSEAWRNLVVCQEIGHTFGLGHQDETFDNTNLNTCMDYTNSPDSNQHPNPHDYELLSAIYAHLDSYDSYAKASDGTKPRGKPQATGQNIDLNNPSAWGEVVAKDGQNNPSVYKRDLGNGEVVFTHVYWVDGEHAHEEHVH